MKKTITLLTLLCSFSLSQSNAQVLAGGDMETWKTYTGGMTSMQKPTSWNSSDSLVGFVKLLGSKTYSARITKSTSVKHGGTASARMAATDLTDSLPTILSNGNFSGDLAALAAGDFSSLKYSGGASVTKRINFVHSWIQYSFTGAADSGRVNVTAFKNGIAVGGKDSTVGEGFTIINSLSSFTKIETYINYVNATIIPDRIVVTFTTSIRKYPITGTLMYVDDVSMSDPLGIETPLENDNRFSVYPIPATKQLNIISPAESPATVRFYNALGQMVLSQNIQSSASIDIGTLAIGNYVLVISDAASERKYFSTTIVKQ
jgi:hypothetical protein